MQDVQTGIKCSLKSKSKEWEKWQFSSVEIHHSEEFWNLSAMNLDSLSKKKFSSPFLESDQSRNFVMWNCCNCFWMFLSWMNLWQFQVFCGRFVCLCQCHYYFTRIHYLFILFILFITKIRYRSIQYYVFVIPSSIVYISVLYQNINKERVKISLLEY